MTSEEIRRRRKQLGLTQKELAEKLGIAKLTVSAWETGRNSPKSTIVIQALESIFSQRQAGL